MRSEVAVVKCRDNTKAMHTLSGIGFPQEHNFLKKNLWPSSPQKFDCI